MNFAERRTKTNPDESQLLSMSSQSSARSSAVKSTIKVYSEMKEDQSCKLAMRSNQLKVVLGTYSIFCAFDKLRNQRMQHYLDVLFYNAPHKLPNLMIPSKQSSQSYLTPPVKKKSVKFQSECSPASCLLFKQLFLKQVQQYFTAIKNYQKKPKVQPIKLLEVLEKLYFKKTSPAIKMMKKLSQIDKGLRKIAFFHNLKTRKFIYGSLFKMAFVGEFNINLGKISILEEPQLVSSNNYDQNLETQIASTKEQLAMKFASTSIMIGILSQRIIKIQFALLFHLRSSVHKSSKPNELKSLDASDVLEYSEEEKLKPQIIAAHQIFNALQKKLKQNFDDMVTMLISPSNISIQYYKPPRPSIKLFKNNGHQKLQAFVKKMFVEDHKIEEPIRDNGIQLVAEYQDPSKSQISSESMSNTQSANTMEDSQSTKQLPVKQPLIQPVKKERLNQAIQNYLSPAHVKKAAQPVQKSQLQKQENRNILAYQISLLISLIFILIILAIRVL